jgi:hypothetical protein
VRRLILTVGMLLMGLALVVGAANSFMGASLIPLDQEIGTHPWAADAVLGLGLIAASFRPAANLGWVRAGALYGFAVLAFEAGPYFVRHATFHVGPVLFGIAFSLVLIAAYPERRRLVPTARREEPPGPSGDAEAPAGVPAREAGSQP